MSSGNTTSRTTRLGIKSISVSFFTKLIKLIERTKNRWKSYDDTIYLTLTKELVDMIETNPLLLTTVCPEDVGELKKQYWGLTAMECCCSITPRHSYRNYMLFDLAKLGADATDKCYYYIMEEQDKKMKRDCFLFLMYSGYMPLKLKTLSSGDDGDENDKIYTVDYIADMLIDGHDNNLDALEFEYCGAGGSMLNYLVVLHKMIHSNAYIMSEYVCVAEMLASKNEKLPKLGSGFTHKKDGPMAKLIKKFTRDFVWGEWDLLNNDVGRYGIPPWH